MSQPENAPSTGRSLPCIDRKKGCGSFKEKIEIIIDKLFLMIYPAVVLKMIFNFIAKNLQSQQPARILRQEVFNVIANRTPCLSDALPHPVCRIILVPGTCRVYGVLASREGA